MDTENVNIYKLFHIIFLCQSRHVYNYNKGFGEVNQYGQAIENGTGWKT